MMPSMPSHPTIQALTARALPYLCLTASMSLVGCYVALSKPLVAALPVFLLAWLRFAIGGLAMLHWLKKPADEPPISPRTKRLLFLESFFGNFLFSVCMLFGVALTTATSAGVIMSSIPGVIAVLSWAFLKERITKPTLAGIACAAIGIGMFSMQKSGPSTIHSDQDLTLGLPRHVWGNVLVFAAVVCEASYVVIGKRLTDGLGPKRISAIINLWGFVLVTPLGIWAARDFAFAAVAPPLWVLLVFYALAASMWTVWLWMTGLKSIPASRAGVFSVMLPVSAAAVGVLFLGETLTPGQVMAFAVALVGLVMATLPGRSA